MPLVVIRKQFETWRECVRRYGRELEQECLEEFDKLRALGVEESRAAFDALSEWDCLGYEDTSRS